MLHSGVFVGRQYAAFAHITHGQKVHDFHVHHKPLYAAVGEPDDRNRRRVAIDRLIERLMVLDGVLADRSVTWLGSERESGLLQTARFGNDLRDDEYPRLVFGKRARDRT